MVIVILALLQGAATPTPRAVSNSVNPTGGYGIRPYEICFCP